MGQDVKQVDIVFHYPPELTQLLINTIPFRRQFLQFSGLSPLCEALFIQ